VAASALAADVTTLRLANDSVKPPYTILFRISNALLLVCTIGSLLWVISGVLSVTGWTTSSADPV
jgi:hypothetical protein